MDWNAARVSLALAALTALTLLPPALWLARWLATSPSRARPFVEAGLLLPLLLPPTVIGFYLLVGLGGASPLGGWLATHLNLRLVFSFEGLLFASVLINLPFMVQPLQRALAAIPRSVREAAWVSGLSGWRTFWRIELPLAWPGVLAGVALTFAHTLGEFGVVLMVGGNIGGQTRTLSIAIYDRVQAFDNTAAAQMSLLLVAMSLAALALVFALNRRNPLQER
ncbi:MAG TPA: molybdate ABC transporter permease subunit [Albitalea sp.]|jgi:molybdate transport system permease protein|nr:molybdate ABC transporter permease subunit [Albitalea sp.]